MTALDLLYIFGFVEVTEVKEQKLTCVFRHVSSIPSHCQRNDIPSTAQSLTCGTVYHQVIYDSMAKF